MSRLPNVRTPRAEEVATIAKELGFSFSQEDVQSFTALLDGPIASYNRLDELVEPKLPDKYSRMERPRILICVLMEEVIRRQQGWSRTRGRKATVPVDHLPAVLLWLQMAMSTWHLAVIRAVRFVFRRAGVEFMA